MVVGAECIHVYLWCGIHFLLYSITSPHFVTHQMIIRVASFHRSFCDWWYLGLAPD